MIDNWWGVKGHVMLGCWPNKILKIFKFRYTHFPAILSSKLKFLLVTFSRIHPIYLVHVIVQISLNFMHKFTIKATFGTHLSHMLKTMPQRRGLSIADRGRAHGWIQEGIAMREAARRLNVSSSVIRRQWVCFQTTGEVHEQRRPGRPRITTRRQDRFIVTTALRQRIVTANTLRCLLRNEANVNVSDQTIRNRLRESNLRSRRQAVRLPLLPHHRVNRLAWARRHVRWNRRQWNNVQFTDESRFCLQHSDGRIHVYRRPGTTKVWWRVSYGVGRLQQWSSHSPLSHPRESDCHKVSGWDFATPRYSCPKHHWSSSHFAGR